jgi:hypothetical protein
MKTVLTTLQTTQVSTGPKYYRVNPVLPVLVAPELRLRNSHTGRSCWDAGVFPLSGNAPTDNSCSYYKSFTAP